MQVATIKTGPGLAADPRPPANPRDATKIGHAASEFESLLIAQMLRSARDSSASDSDDSDGAETNPSLMELGDQQFAQALANSGGLGIAKIVVAGLNPAGLNPAGLNKYAHR